MGKSTTIAWADSTLSLSMGCSHGCCLAGGHCYAETWCRRYAGRKGYCKDFRKPELFLHRLDEVLRWKDLTGTTRPGSWNMEGTSMKELPKPWLDGLPRVVFLNDLGETFDPQLPRDWLADELLAANAFSGHQGQKRPVLEQLAASPLDPGEAFLAVHAQPELARDHFLGKIAPGDARLIGNY